MSRSEQPGESGAREESAEEHTTLPPSGPDSESPDWPATAPSADEPHVWKPKPPRLSARFSVPLPGHTLLERYMVLGQLGEAAPDIVRLLEQEVAAKNLRAVKIGF